MIPTLTGSLLLELLRSPIMAQFVARELLNLFSFAPRAEFLSAYLSTVSCKSILG